MDTDTVELLECGHAESPHSDTTRGYGTDPTTGARSCYDCCAKADEARLEGCAQSGEPFYAYLSSEPLPLRGGSHAPWYAVTNWPGMRIGGLRAHLGTLHNWSSERHYITAVDSRGRLWHGTGAPGMYAVLRVNRRAAK